MAVVSLVSAKGSPGVTVAALALTLTWPRRVVLAECDPTGSDLYPGFLESRLESRWGLGPLMVANRRGTLETEFWQQLVDLNPPAADRLLLPGIVNPAQAANLVPLWDQLAGLLASLERGEEPLDAIVDCGRVEAMHAPAPLLRRADMVVLVVRGTLPSLAAARPRVTALQQDLAQRGTGADAVALLLVGDGPYTAAEVAKELGAPVLATLPYDRSTGRVLSLQGSALTARHRREPLLRTAHGATAALRDLVARRRARLNGYPAGQYSGWSHATGERVPGGR
jgi:hypothetical protein